MEKLPTKSAFSPLGKRGVLYCAYNRKYIDIAAFSAATLKQHMDISCCIITANPKYAKKVAVFDHALDIGYPETLETFFVKADRLPSLKLLALAQSPFEKTLHLDCDTVVLGDLSPVFDKLQAHDLLLTNDSESNFDLDHSTGRRVHRNLLRFTNQEAFNTGVLAYSNSATTKEFLNAWVKDFIETSKIHPDTGNWSNVNDQVSLSRVIKNQLPAKLGLSWSVLPNIEYNVTGRMIPELARQNKLNAAKIIHTIFAQNWLKQGNAIDSIANDPSLKQFAGNMD